MYIFFLNFSLIFLNFQMLKLAIMLWANKPQELWNLYEEKEKYF